MTRRILQSWLVSLIFGLSILPLAAQSGVFISEFMADNARVLADEDGAFSDWIELHNATAQPVNLEGYSLTDDPGWLTKWTFPAVTLPPDGYLIVFASGKNRTNAAAPLHTSFQLNNGGEFLALVRPDGVTVASGFSPEFPNQREDVAYGIAQKPITTALLATAVPQVLVPTNAAELPADWNAAAFQPGANWFNGAAPVALGFDTSQPVGTLVNVARGGTAVQSTTSGSFTANLANDGSLANYALTLSTDNAPFWQVTLASDANIYRIVLRNRTSCCQSRLRDITVQILGADGVTTNFTSPLLNPENTGYTYPAGPAVLEVDMSVLAGGAVPGQIVRVHRTPDPDLSGSASQGGTDETAQLALAEVEVYASTVSGQVNLARTGSPAPTATQSSTLSSYAPDLAINGNLGDFTHTASADQNPSWTLNLGRMALITSVVVHNRDSCCQSRLRDITVDILAANGTSVLYTSSLLNPENTGYSFPGGPDNLVVDLATQPVLGQYIRVRRTADPDLSGSGGQGNQDEASVLSLGEVIVNGADITGYRPFIRTDLEARMLNLNASAFVRLPFTVADPSVLNALTLQLRYDDGFIVYLNGTKVAERNAPATPAWNATATADRSIGQGISPEVIELAGAIGQLTAGANVLAIHALNSSASDDNFLLQPELTSQHSVTSPYAYLVDATPGTRNETDYFFDDVADTQFSVNRGFFDDPFTLEITSATPDALIYYSFDGSEPGPGKGMLYTGPLAITNTTIVRARAFKEFLRATDVDTQTYLFLDDVVQQAPTGAPPPYFPASWGANRVDYGMDPNVVSQYTPAEWREALTQIPTMSLVTEMAHLFDPATGIYANALQHGIDWERPGSIELLDPTNSVPGRFQENCGLRIRGGYSRNPQFVKHSFRVFFRREYGAPKLNYPLFENEGTDEFDTFDLRTSQNYSWPRETSPSNGNHDTMVREVFCRETLGAMGQPYRRSRYYHLYLNGQYWGLYETDERPEASYGATYFGGSKEDYDVVKCANHVGAFVTEVTDGNFTAWSNLWTMTRTLATAPTEANYFRILGRNADGTRNPALPVMLDVDNLIDYMLGIFYSGDGDATLSGFLSNTRPNNWFGMKNRNNPDQGFRFFNSDCEHTLGAPSWRDDRTGPFGGVAGSNIGNFTYSNPQYLHEDLMLNAEYRLRFADRVQKHFFNGGAVTPEAGTNRFLKKAVQITKAIRAYSARWGDGAPKEPPYGEAEWNTMINTIVTTWFPGRTATVLLQLQTDNLFPAIDAPVFSQFGGEITEGFALSLSNPNAGGAIYFTLDGTDPRLVGGAVSSTAAAYSTPIILNASTRVKARVLNGTTWSALAEADFAVPGLVPLRITELMYHPAAVSAAEAAAGFSNADDFEFIELRNVGAISINLAGIAFVNGISFTFQTGALAPGERLVLVKNVAAYNLRYGPAARVEGYYEGNLSNGGERLRLQDATARTLHDFSFADGWHPITDGFGFSLVILDDGAPTSTWSSRDSWRPSSRLGGSPGAENPALPGIPLVVINEVLTRPTAPDQVSLELANLTGEPAEVSHWWLSDDFSTPGKFQLPPNTVIPAGGFVVFTEDDFGAAALGVNALNLSSAGAELRLFSGNADGELTGYYQGWDFGPADAGVSFGRHVTSTGADHFVAQAATSFGQTNAGPRVGPVVISEIMYRPPDLGTNDNSRDEYLELLNRSTNAVELSDALAPSNTWRIVGGVDFLFPTHVTLEAGERLLLVNFNPALESALAADFRNRYAVPAAVRLFGPYGGRLDNSGESLELRRPTLLPTGQPAWVLLERINYGDAAPWPAGADGFGPSLQRKDALAYGNDPANWAAARARAGQSYVPVVPPAVSLDPPLVTTAEFTTVSFNAVVTGAGPFTYVWRLGGTVLPDATNATLNLDQVALADAGTYSVGVLNAAGAIAVATATLNVLPVAQITAHPQDLMVNPGETATFSVTAMGTGALTYQWRHNGEDLPGANQASLAVPNAQFDVNDGYYTVVVTDEVGSRESAPARLTVRVRPTITSNLEILPSTNVLAGRTFTLTISASGTPPMGFRFRAPGAAYFAVLVLESNHNTATLVVENAKPELHNGNWDVGITNVGGSALSTRYTVTVEPAAPFFAVQPADQTATAGDAVTWTSEARGTEPISYQWYFNGLNALAGATNAALGLTNVQPADAGDYRVVATNTLGAVTSAVARLALGSGLQIISQPANQNPTPCGAAAFTVQATGTVPLTYQWFFNASLPLEGATSATLTIPLPRWPATGDYHVVVSDASGSVTSQLATLTLALGDCDGDDMADEWEMAHGLNPSDPADRNLDPDADGRTNWEEAQSGTHPQNPASVLRVHLLNGGAGGALLQFTAEAAISYTLQFRTNLLNGSWTVLSDVPAQPAAHAVEITDPLAGAEGSRFYRIVTPMQP